jgi:hypothetical protein
MGHFSKNFCSLSQDFYYNKKNNRKKNVVDLDQKLQNRNGESTWKLSRLPLFLIFFLYKIFDFMRICGTSTNPQIT